MNVFKLHAILHRIHLIAYYIFKNVTCLGDSTICVHAGVWRSVLKPVNIEVQFRTHRDRFPDPTGRPRGEDKSGEEVKCSDIKSFTDWFYNKRKFIILSLDQYFTLLLENYGSKTFTLCFNMEIMTSLVYQLVNSVMLHNLQRSEKSQSNDKVKSTKVIGLHFTKEQSYYDLQQN